MDRETFLNTCQTGDLLLYSTTNTWYSRLIEYFSRSKFSHIAIILRDPTYINENLKGLYILESGAEPNPSPEDGKRKYGVQITKLEDVLDQYMASTGKGQLYYRKLDCDRTGDFTNKIKKIHDMTYDKPYDFILTDWIKAEFDIEIGDEQRKNTFWCSALVSFAYIQLGFLGKTVPWTIISPKEYSYYEDSETLKFQNCSLIPEIKLAI
mgnify:CR=1 FL=1